MKVKKTEYDSHYLKSLFGTILLAYSLLGSNCYDTCSTHLGSTSCTEDINCKWQDATKSSCHQSFKSSYQCPRMQDSHTCLAAGCAYVEIPYNISTCIAPNCYIDSTLDECRAEEPIYSSKIYAWLAEKHCTYKDAQPAKCVPKEFIDSAFEWAESVNKWAD